MKTAKEALFILESKIVFLQCDWRLNERHYGALTGFCKHETEASLGPVVRLWRRSYRPMPPPMTSDHQFWEAVRAVHDRNLSDVSASPLPTSESLAMTAVRVESFWRSTLLPAIAEGRRPLVVAHGNSLRALLYSVLESMSEQQLISLHVPTGTPMHYSLCRASGEILRALPGVSQTKTPLLP